MSNKIDRNITKLPPRIELIKRRRGMHTHETNQKFIESSSSFTLIAMLNSLENEKHIKLARKAAQRETRRIFIKNVEAEIEKLKELQETAIKWSDQIFYVSKPIWEKYLISAY